MYPAQISDTTTHQMYWSLMNVEDNLIGREILKFVCVWKENKGTLDKVTGYYWRMMKEKTFFNM